MCSLLHPLVEPLKSSVIVIHLFLNSNVDGYKRAMLSKLYDFCLRKVKMRLSCEKAMAQIIENLLDYPALVL